MLLDITDGAQGIFAKGRSPGWCGYQPFSRKGQEGRGEGWRGMAIFGVVGEGSPIQARGQPDSVSGLLEMLSDLSRTLIFQPVWLVGDDFRKGGVGEENKGRCMVNWVRRRDLGMGTNEWMQGYFFKDHPPSGTVAPHSWFVGSCRVVKACVDTNMR